MLDIMTNAPRPVRYSNREYLTGSLKIKELGRLQRWLRDHTESPLAVFRHAAPFLPEKDRAAAYRDAVAAQRDWPPVPGSIDGNAALFRDPDGQALFLALMLRKFQDVDDAELEQIAAGLSEEDFGVLVAIAFGEDDLDPESVRTVAREHLKALASLQEAAVHVAAEALAGESSSPTSGTEAKDSAPTSSESSPSDSLPSSETTESSPAAGAAV